MQIMANWTVSDELDARLRERLGVEDPAAYAERIITDQLDWEDDPEYSAEVDRQIKQSRAELAAGRATDAREGMRQIADEFGINLKR